MNRARANIHVVLIGARKLRVNELYRALCRLGIKVSKSTFLAHLDHLKKQKLIRREKGGKQNVAYVLNEDHPIERKHSEDVKRWLGSLEGWKETRSGLPQPPRAR